MIRKLITMVGVTAAAAHAQCTPGWQQEFGHSHPQGPLRAAKVWNNELYVGGSTMHIDGSITPYGLAKYVGGRWMPICDGLQNATVLGGGTFDLTRWDRDGNGPGSDVLIVGLDGGTFSCDVAMVDDGGYTLLTSFPVAQSEPGIRAVSTFSTPSDGPPRLYAAGDFEVEPGKFGLAVCDPVTLAWTSAGGFSSRPDQGNRVLTMLVHNDGSGDALYVAGRMPTGVEGVSGTTNIARWNGTSWTSVGGGRNHPIGKLLSFDPDGTGPLGTQLVAAGNGAVSFWDGVAWTSYSLPNSDNSGFCDTVQSAAVLGTSSDGQLYIGSNNCLGLTEPRYYRFTGSGFVPVPEMGSALWYMLESISTPSGPVILTDRMQVWDGSDLRPFGVSTPPQDRPGLVSHLMEFDPDGNGPAPVQVLAAGFSADSSGFGADNPIVALWNGATWEGISDGLPDEASVTGVVANGAELYVGVNQQDLLQSIFDAGVYHRSGAGASWTRLEGDFRWPDGEPAQLAPVLARLNGNDHLFAVGRFASVGGSLIHGLARWDGAQWVEVGGGLTPRTILSPDYWHTHFTWAESYDDGSGEALFVSGNFTQAGTLVPAAPVVRWKGLQWEDVSDGLPPLPTSQNPSSQVYYKLVRIGDDLIAYITGFWSEFTPPPLAWGRIYRWTIGPGGGSWVVDPNFARMPDRFLGAAHLPETGLTLFGEGAQSNTSDNAGLSSRIFTMPLSTGEWSDATEQFGLLTWGGAITLLETSIGGSDALFVGGAFLGVNGHAVPGIPNSSNGITATPSPGIARFILNCPLACDSIDFNADGLFPDDADLVDFLSVLAGGACSTGTCNDIDFNNDGLFPDDADLVAFLNVLAGGNCG